MQKQANGVPTIPKQSILLCQLTLKKTNLYADKKEMQQVSVNLYQFILYKTVAM